MKTGLTVLISWALAMLLAAEPIVHKAEGHGSAVATTHPLATEAALEILRGGGNAIDATVAAGLALGVVDGHNSGLGGGCFFLIRSADGKITALDGREMAPRAATRDMFVHDGVLDTQGSKVGPLASGVPGSLAVYDHALRVFGKRKLADCLAPAIRYAETGFAVDRVWASKAAAEVENLRKFPGSRAALLHPDGSPLKEGETLAQPDLAATLNGIAAGGIEYFYQGPFAEKVADWMAANGGLLTREDFAGYELREREPLRSAYRGYEVIGMPPPSSGGVHVAQILNILEHYDYAALSPADRAHLFLEAEKLAFADRAHWLGDADFVKVPQGLIDKAYAAELAGKIDLRRAATAAVHGTPPHAESEWFGKHTTHFTVVDAEGNWAACTATVNTPFGSKVIVPGTGVVLNNQMDDFSIQAGVPNAFGLVGSEANAIAPGKRPLSSMSPTILLKDGQPVMTVGAAGGPLIITQAALAVIRHVDLGFPLDACLGDSRLHHQWSPAEASVEKGFDPQVLAELRARGHEIKLRSSFGLAQAIARLPDGRSVAVSDPRGEGRAAIETNEKGASVTGRP